MILWYPSAIKMLGPAWKQGYRGYTGRNLVAGVINHSAEGYEYGIWDVLMHGDTSWHFTVLKDGRVFQHYALDAVCWHAGAQLANQRLDGVEHEGVAGEPLTPAQLMESVQLTHWIALQGGWVPSRVPPTTLREHREISGTDCPSGRIPWDAYLIPRNAEFVIPAEEEAEVKVRELDQSETIAAFEDVARNLGPALNDRPANWWESIPLTVVEVTEGSPRPIPPGGRALLFITKDT